MRAFLGEPRKSRFELAFALWRLREKDKGKRFESDARTPVCTHLPLGFGYLEKKGTQLLPTPCMFISSHKYWFSP